MRITEIVIENFRNVSNKTFDLKPKYNVFVGANGLGKTTLIDSVLWVLCGETIVYGKSDPDNRNKNDLRLPIGVKITFDNNLVLERKYKDIWVEDKDGNVKYSRTDNNFFINGAKFKKEEYFSFIRDKIKFDRNLEVKDFNFLRFLIDYDYFGNIDYKVARKFIEKCIKIKSDDELILEQKYAPVRTDMQVLKYEYGKLLNKYSTIIKQADAKIEEIQTKIVKKQELVKPEDIEAYEKLNQERKELLNSTFDNQNYQAKIKDLDTRISQSQQNVLLEIVNVNQQINTLIKKGNELKYQIDNMKSNIEDSKRYIQKLTEEQEEYTSLIEEKQKEKFTEKVCPYCGGVINKDEETEFKENIEKEVEILKAQIEGAKQGISGSKVMISSYEEKIEIYDKEFEKTSKEYVGLTTRLEELSVQKENNEEAKKLSQEKAKLEDEYQLAINTFNSNKNAKIGEISTQMEKLAVSIQASKELEELKQQLKDCKQQKYLCESNIDLIKDFKATKLNNLVSKVKEVFPQIDIELIEENENTGSFKDVCYTKLNGVEFTGVNDGFKYLLGIEIIENIKKHLGVEDLPIIFDKFADIDKETFKTILGKTNSQIICTKVTDNKEIEVKGE